MIAAIPSGRVESIIAQLDEFVAGEDHDDHPSAWFDVAEGLPEFSADYTAALNDWVPQFALADGTVLLWEESGWATQRPVAWSAVDPDRPFLGEIAARVSNLRLQLAVTKRRAKELADLIADDLGERDELIRDALRRGVPYRELGELTGLSRPALDKIRRA